MNKALNLCKLLIAIALVVATASFAFGMIIGVARSIPNVPWHSCN
jgi:hypothetical protein